MKRMYTPTQAASRLGRTCQQVVRWLDSHPGVERYMAGRYRLLSEEQLIHLATSMEEEPKARPGRVPKKAR